MSSLRKFTVAELETLTGRENAAVAYRGKVYDISAFIDKHPGGARQLLLTAGRDITTIFEVYHDKNTRSLFSSKCKLIGTLEDSPVEIKTVEEDKLFLTLEKRVRDYFKANNIDPKIHIPYFCASYFVLLCTILLWFSAIVLVYLGYSLLLCCALALLSGFCAAISAITGSHDLSHFSWTHSPLVWKMVGTLYSCVHGIGTYTWHYQHVVGHHSNPNHDILDPDVATKDKDVWRITPFQSYFSHYSYQHIYMPILYCIMSVKLKLQDFHLLYLLRTANVPINPPSLEEVSIFVCIKVVHVFYRWVLPGFYISLPQLFLLNLLSELIMGSWVAHITLVNHVNLQLSWYTKDSPSYSTLSWSEMIIQTTADYATNSVLWNFVTGGLNLQVLHHMFPWVLSFNLRLLVPILKETLDEFGVKYHYYDTFWEIWKAHVEYLRQMGEMKLSGKLTGEPRASDKVKND